MITCSSPVHSLVLYGLLHLLISGLTTCHRTHREFNGNLHTVFHPTPPCRKLSESSPPCGTYGKPGMIFDSTTKPGQSCRLYTTPRWTSTCPMKIQRRTSTLIRHHPLLSSPQHRSHTIHSSTRAQKSPGFISLLQEQVSLVFLMQPYNHIQTGTDQGKLASASSSTTTKRRHGMACASKHSPCRPKTPYMQKPLHCTWLHQRSGLQAPRMPPSSPTIKFWRRHSSKKTQF